MINVYVISHFNLSIFVYCRDIKIEKKAEPPVSNVMTAYKESSPSPNLT